VKQTRKTSGQELVRMALERGESLTAMDALHRFGMYRLATAIHALKAKGLPIVADTIETPGGARVARYRLTKAVKS
jgi:Helix-turn-helix domain